MNEESILMESNGGHVILTDRRIVYEENAKDFSHLISIMLDQISGIEVLFKMNLRLLVYSIISFVVALGTAFVSYELLVLFVLIGGVFLVLFFRSRKHVMSISSSGTKIIFHTQGMSKLNLKEFVDKLQEAQFEYTKIGKLRNF